VVIQRDFMKHDRMRGKWRGEKVNASAHTNVQTVHDAALPVSMAEKCATARLQARCSGFIGQLTDSKVNVFD
jgi:hypothetical protein